MPANLQKNTFWQRMIILILIFEDYKIINLLETKKNLLKTHKNLNFIDFFR